MGMVDRQTRSYVRSAMAERMLDPETETTLARAWRDSRDERALHRLIRAYSRLAISLAGRFRRYDIPYEDLVQQANLGLMRAAEKFDPENGARFSTYATWWIRASMQDYVLRNWSLVRTGTTSAQKKLFFHLRRELLQRERAGLGGEGLVQDLARSFDVPEDQVELMLGRMSGPDLSLDAPQSGDEDSRTWVDLLEDEGDAAGDLLERMDHDRRRGALRAAIARLPERERQIVAARHLSDEPATLSDLGQAMGISKERVRQLEERALSRLRGDLQHQDSQNAMPMG
jgi:RNA polymerase sigma-32 factor